MHYSPFIFSLVAASSVQAANIVLTNDDGWAEANVRTLFNVLTSVGNKVVLSAPSENQSGRSSLEGIPWPAVSGCQYNSCPPNSPPRGSDPTDPRLNYVNSFPVTAMKHGAGTLASKLLGGKVDLVVSGPNVGTNLFLSVPFSGTVGAASAAADQLKIPGLAFSGSSGDPTSFATMPTPLTARIYADWAANVTSAVLAGGGPYLPDNSWLNVNFPPIGPGCEKSGDVKFVLSRIYTAVPFLSDEDVSLCGNTDRLPTETKVVETKGCYASISVGKASNKLDQEVAEQAFVAKRLARLLVCLPK